MVLPANVDTGLVEGRFLVGVIDGPDPDTEPEGLPAQGTITFTASVPYLPNPTANPAPVTILKAPIVGVLDGEGYLCARKPDGTAGARGVRLVATDDPDLSVQGWTWAVTYTFENVNGVRPQIASHSMALPGGTTVDLTSVVKVPSSTGIGVEQAEALAASATSAAQEAAASAALAAQAAEATDTGVAALVTYGGATTETLDRAYRTHVSVMEHGATGDGATDDTAAIQAALTANPGGSIYFPPGHYRLTRALAVPAGTFLSGADSTSTSLDWSTMSAFRDGALLEWGQGTLYTSTALAVDARFGDPSITLTPGHGFVAGDYLRLTTEEVLFSEMTKAEFHRVLEVAGDVLHLSGPVLDTYTTALSERVQRADLSTGGLHGLSIIGKGINTAGYGNDAVRFALARDVHISDVKFAGVENKCIQLDSVLGANVNGCHFLFDPSRTPLQYGVAIQGASQMVTVQGCSSWNDRHMVTTATSQSLAEHSTALRGIPRIITITGCTAHGSWQCPVDTHRGGEYVTVTGCSLNTESTGIKFRGKHSIAVGNVIIGKRTSVGGAPYGVRIGMLCEDIQVTGNLIRNFESGVRIDTPDSTTRALVVSENSILDCDTGVYVHGGVTVAELRIAGNTIRTLPAGYGIHLRTGITDLTITGNTLAGGVSAIHCGSSTANIARATVQGNTLRGQSSYGMFLRNITDGLVTTNFTPAAEIRFAGTCDRVVTGLNVGTITDLSTPGVTQN